MTVLLPNCEAIYGADPVRGHSYCFSLSSFPLKEFMYMRSILTEK